MPEPTNTMEAILAEGRAAAAALGGQPGADQGINNMALAFEKARDEMITATDPPIEAAPADPPIKEAEAPKEPAVVNDPPKSDAPKEPEIVVPEAIKTGKAQAEFKKVVAAEKEALKRAEAAEARLREIEARKPEELPEMVKLREENERYSKELEITNVTKHPRFVAYFDGKVKAVATQAEQYFGKEQAPKIMEILEAPPSRQRNQALSELLPDLDDMDRQQLGAIALKSDEIKLERRSEIERAGTLAAQMKERQVAEQANYQKHLESRFGAALAESRKTYRLFQPKEGDDEWNKGIPVLEERAKKIFSGLNTPEEAAQAAVFAAMAPRQMEFIAVQDAYIKKLESQIESLQKATPTIPANGRPASNGKPKEPLSFVEMATGLMRGDIPMPPKTR